MMMVMVMMMMMMVMIGYLNSELFPEEMLAWIESPGSG